MAKMVKLLLVLQIRGAFGINEALHGKDSRKKHRLVTLLISFVAIGIMLMLYIGGSAYALAYVGMAKIIPAYLMALTSVVIFFFSLFRSGSAVFDLKAYERLIVLPIKPSAIVVSRFLSFYLFNMLMSFLVMLPGSVIYAIFTAPPASFYVLTFIGTMLLPLIPMTVATAAGALIYAVSSRLRHMNIVSMVLSLALVVGVVLLSFAPAVDPGMLSASRVASAASSVMNAIIGVYPPAALFSAAAVGGDWGAMAIFAAVSIVLFVVFAALVQWRFEKICTALKSSVSKRDYVMREQHSSSALHALYIKELKRYFASNIYVMNTSMGYILMVVMAVAALAFGADKLDQVLKMGGLLPKLAPVVLSLFYVISPPSTCSISMEGKQWWIPCSLPISPKTLFDSKLLVSLTLAAPCGVVAATLIAIAVSPTPLELAGIILMPFAYMLFSIVAGLFVNIRMPMMNWDSETVAVKQSGAVLVTMLIGFVSVGIPAALLFLLPPGIAPFVPVAAAVAATGAAAALYASNNRKDLRKIG